MDENTVSLGERIFRNWEIVKQIFSYLPWQDVCRLRNISEETRYACQFCVDEIVDPAFHGISDVDVYDLLMAMGRAGCKNLKKIDFQTSNQLSINMAPLMKFCENIKYLGLSKGKQGRELYYYVIYNPDIEHLAIQPVVPEYFQNADLLDVIFVLPNLSKLELPSTKITDIGLSEIVENMPHLLLLNVSNCLDITDNGLKVVLTECKYLKHLNVQNTPTMEDLVYDIFLHCHLEYLNALETQLSAEHALEIKTNFDRSFRPYQFLYSRTIITTDDKYHVVPVKHVHSKDIDEFVEMADFRYDPDTILDDVVIDDVSESDWIDPLSEEYLDITRALTMSAEEYLEGLQEDVHRPYNRAFDYIFNWAEKAFKVEDTVAERCRRSRAAYDPDNEDPEYRWFDPERNYQRVDIGWQQIYKACENVEFMQREFDLLLQKFAPKLGVKLD